MPSLSPRQQRLLDYLLSCSTPVSAAVLADISGVSKRTIMNDLQRLRQEYPKQLCSSHQGYILQMASSSAPSAEEEYICLIPHNRKERSLLLLNKLLSSSSPINLPDFAEMSCISTESIRKDISFLRLHLKEYQCILIQHRDTLQLKGPEHELRQLWRRVIYQKAAGRLTLEMLMHLFPQYRSDKLRKKLLVLFREHHFFLNDNYWPDFLLEILLACRRYQLGFPLSDVPAPPSTLPRPFLQAFILLLHKLLPSSFAIEEQDYCAEIAAIYLLPCQFSTIDIKKIIAVLPQKHAQSIQAFFQKDLPEAIPFLTPDDDLIRHLAFQLHALAFSLHRRHPIYDAQKENMKSASPFAFLMACRLVHALKKRFPLPLAEDAAALIAIHLALACQRQHDVGRRKLKCGLVIPPFFDYADELASRLQENFAASLDFIGLTQCEDDLTPVAAADLLLSTIPFSQKTAAPVVVVDPLLSPEIIMNIQNHIALLQKQKRRMHLQTFLLTASFVKKLPRQGLTVFYRHLALRPCQFSSQQTFLLIERLPRPAIICGEHVEFIMELHVCPEQWELTQENLDLLLRTLAPVQTRHKALAAPTHSDFADLLLKHVI